MRVAASVVGGIGGVVRLLVSLRTSGFGTIGLAAGSAPSLSTAVLGALMVLAAALAVTVFGLLLVPPAGVREEIGAVSLYTLPLIGAPFLLGGALLAFLDR